MAPLETHLLKLSSWLELNNFVKEVFKGLAFYTVNNLENTATASKKLKHTLEETKRDIIRQVLTNCCPLDFLISGLLSAQFQQKAKKKYFPFNVLIEIDSFFSLLVPETLFLPNKTC